MNIFNNRKNIFCVILTILLALLLINSNIRGGASASNSITHDYLKKTDKLMDFGIDVYDVLIGGAQGNIENSLRKDALRDCPSVIRKLRFEDSNDYKNELETIEYYMKQYYKYGYLPREPYSPVPNGKYVTSMDAPLLGVCCQLAYERTEDIRYKKYLNDLIPYFVKDTKNNGFVLKENENSWWPLEYAWKNVSSEDAWYVYNGSLFGMVCIELLKKATGNPLLYELSANAYNSYLNHSKQFLYKDGNWCYYALNSVTRNPIINRSEKLFIEMRALKALYILTNRDLYYNQYLIRESLFKKLYPVYMFLCGDKYNISFLRAGAPHPYYVDIYRTKLEIFDREYRLIKSFYANDRNAAFSYIYGEIAPNAKYYKLYAGINPIKESLITEGEISKVNFSNYEHLNYSSSFWGDCLSFDGKIININSEYSEKLKAILELELNKNYTNNPEGYFIFEIDNRSMNTYPVQIVVTDSHGNTSQRYLPPLVPGNNSLIFNYLGIPQSNPEFKNIKHIRIDIITNKMKNNIGILNLKSSIYCDKTFKVINYLQQKLYKNFWN